MGSIRWRLPLSYAGIALLAVLVLGGVLLLTLARYYRDQEIRYLTSNAFVISSEVAGLLRDEAVPLEAVTAQLRGFAFLSQTRVRLLDADEALVADSGALVGNEQAVSVVVDIESEIEEDGASFSRETTQIMGDDATFQSRIVVEDGLFSQNVEETIVLNGGQDTIVETSPFGVQGTPFGLGLNQGETAVSHRSSQIIRYPITDIDGQNLGYIELSQGPAYGTAVLQSVAWGWGLSGLVAVLLAALVGWRVSRRLTQPLLALTAVTEQMSGGDLSARAAVSGQDEVGQLASSFNQMAEQVEGTVQTLRRFVADAAHEINTPLTALKTNLELLDGEENGRREFHLHQAQQQMARLEALTAGLLDLSVVEGEQTAAALERIDLVPLLRQSGELFASRAEQKGLAFELALPERPLWVQGQAIPLQQAVEALLDNALKFTSEGEIRLAAKRAAGKVEILVADTGIGVETDEAGLIFGRFFRGRKTADLPGSGLGLVIAEAIVAQHGGRLYLEEKKREAGSVFVIELSNTDMDWVT